MNYIKKIAIMILAITMTSSAMAATGDTTSTNASLEVKSAPRLIAKTSNSVTLEWDKVDAATSYIVKFSTKSVANSTEKDPFYDNESDPVTSTGTVISTLSDGKPLQAATEYYFSVVALDKDNNESDTYSDELKVKTDEVNTAPSTTNIPVGVAPSTTVAPASVSGTTSTVFALKSANAIDNKTIDLEFSAPLNPKPFSVKITKTTDGSDVPAVSVTTDPSNSAKAIVKISTMLDPKSTYSINVLDVSDASGNNIQQGVDGIKEFTTVENLAQSPETILNAGGPVANMMSGSTASGTLTPNMEVAKTGPRENLLVVLAFVLSFGMFYSYRKRFAK